MPSVKEQPERLTQKRDLEEFFKHYKNLFIQSAAISPKSA